MTELIKILYNGYVDYRCKDEKHNIHGYVLSDKLQALVNICDDVLNDYFANKDRNIDLSISDIWELTDQKWKDELMKHFKEDNIDFVDRLKICPDNEISNYQNEIEECKPTDQKRKDEQIKYYEKEIKDLEEDNINFDDVFKIFANIEIFNYWNENKEWYVKMALLHEAHGSGHGCYFDFNEYIRIKYIEKREPDYGDFHHST